MQATTPRATVRISRLDEAAWLRAHRIQPVARNIENDFLVWSFPDGRDTQHLLVLFREEGAGVELIRSYALARAHELKILSAMRSGDERRARR